MHLRAVTSGAGTEWDVDADDPDADNPVSPSVLRAISVIRERYFEPITLVGLAAEVYISPFHFSRVFTKATGLTPGRFLTAVRLFEAKRLLLTTSLSVADIVCGVGYNSVGTFTSRFSRAVGMTPSQYRNPEVDKMLVAVAPHLVRLPSPQLLREASYSCPSVRAGTSAITTRVSFPHGSGPAQVLVGLFADAVPQSGPVAFGWLATVHSGVRVTIRRVPSGRWNVMAIARYEHLSPAAPMPVGIRSVSMAVPPHGHTIANLDMLLPRPTDAPIAVTLAAPADARRRGATRLRATA